MSDPSYLDDPAFSEEHDGPLITPDRPSDGRDPSPAQIRRRCEAIRRCYPRRPVGSSDSQRWQVPAVTAPADFDIERVA